MLSLLGSLRGGSSFITNSLRFRSNASAYLSRTFVGPISSTVFTWSAWVKRGSLTGTFRLFGASTNTSFGFNSSDQLSLTLNGTTAVTTTAIFRDPSAWYHIVYTQNGATQTIYVNNNLVGTGTTANTVFNTAIAHQLAAANTTNYFDGYLTEVNFIDGQALTPASFGAINSSTGVWAPSRYTGTYGNNGFYLKFGNTSSVAALGTDSSGNGNTWTVNNVLLTAGATYDSMIDVPVNYADGGNGRGNYPTFMPWAGIGSSTLSAANLRATLSDAVALSKFGIPIGKWYWEVTIEAVGGFTTVGIANQNITDYRIGFLNGYGYNSTGTKASTANYSAAYGSSYTTGDIIGVALDLVAGTITFYKNGVSQGVAFTGISTSDIWDAGVTQNLSGQNAIVNINFGQRVFSIPALPSGFIALNTQNMATPSIVNGANFMAATTYTGSAGVQSILNAVNSVSFQPGLVWIKSRTPGATSHALFDSVRGTTKYLSSDTTAAETTNANTLTAFNGDGFSLGTDTTLVNANANSYIAWQWRESITAGLDVVSYAGTGVNRTVAHNLGIAPAMVIVKRSQAGATSNWQVRHTSIAAANSIQLNLPNQAAAAATVWNSTAPSSSVFSLGTSTDVNASGINYVAYCFAEIAGFSRFGSYTGNGLANGPFVFCGFRPRWVMVKRTDVAASWVMFDSSRNPSNLTNLGLIPNDPAVEFTGTGTSLDILSNGIKARGAGAELNASAATYIFAAFAENPSKYALAR